MDIITTHKNTDFDAAASVIAGTILYPGITAVLPRSLNPNVKSFLSLHKDLFKIKAPSEINMDNVERLVVVDTNFWGRVEGGEKLKDKNERDIVLWDHHGEGDIAADWTCREATGANITLMIRTLKKEKKILTPIQATFFLIGLYEDTGSLSFPSTMPEDALAAAFLLEQKADLHIAASFLRHTYNQKQKKVLFEMLEGAETIKVNGYKVSCNVVDISGHVGSLAVVVQLYMEILNLDAAFGIFRSIEGDRCVIIGRSGIDELDIGKIMKSLGGGGHPGAGSAMIKSSKTDGIEKWIIELIKGNQKSSVTVGDLMSYPVYSISPDTTMADTAKVLREKGCTGVPVVDDEKLVGVISRRDFKKVRNNKMDVPVKAFMSRRNITLEPGCSPVEAARLMIKNDIGRLPVIDEKEKIIGIFTRSDAMTYFYDLLPS